MRKYQLELDEEQAKIIQRALDLYMRIGLGQIEYPVCDAITRARFDVSIDQFCAARDELAVVGEKLTGYASNASRGIGSPELPNEFKRACDIHDVIRHRIAWDRSPEGGMGVSFYDPLHWGEGDLPKIKKVED
jgi:hypothetical protein